MIKFGDGYEQKYKDGISNKLLDIDYSFEKRDLNEASAILHFLEERNGIETFLFQPHAPFRKQKRFICRSWSDSFIFYNNYSIRAKFEEVAA